MAEAYSLITNIGASKLASAIASQDTITLTHMAIGDGNGAVYDPDAEAEALLRERYRTPFQSVSPDSANPAWVRASAIVPANEGGWTIREVGLFDDEGDLCFIIKYPETYKPVLASGFGTDLTIEAILEVTNADHVSFSFDGSTLATQEFVENNYVAQNDAGDFLTSVNSDDTLSGDGTADSPLKVNSFTIYSDDTLSGEGTPDNELSVVSASTEQKGAIELATQTEVNNATDEVRAVTPKTLGVRLLNILSGYLSAVTTGESLTGNGTSNAPLHVSQATEAKHGGGRIASNAEALEGTNNLRIISPAKLQLWWNAIKDDFLKSVKSNTSLTGNGTQNDPLIVAQANEELRAGVEIATQAEVTAGTDDLRAITPKKLKSAHPGSIIAGKVGTNYFGFSSHSFNGTIFTGVLPRSYDANKMALISGTSTGHTTDNGDTVSATKTYALTGKTATTVTIDVESSQSGNGSQSPTLSDPDYILVVLP